MRTPPESDWRLLSQNKDRILHEACDRIISDASALLAAPHSSPHAKHLALYKLVTSRDEALGRMFNDWKRSNFYPLLVRLVTEKIINPVDLESYSEETQAVVSQLLE